jgi:type IV secretory pathway VirB6-like protein
MLLALLVLASCDGSSCIKAADFGNITSRSLLLEANPLNDSDYPKPYIDSTNVTGCTSKKRYWMPTNMSLDSGDELKIIAFGQASFCRSSPVAPNLIENGHLKLWLDASDSATLLKSDLATIASLNDDEIYRWKDKSGNNNHANQDGTIGVPFYADSQFTIITPPSTSSVTKPSVYFDGSGRHLKFSEIAQGTELGMTIFVVMKYASSDTNRRLYLGHDTKYNLPTGDGDKLWYNNDTDVIPSSYETYINGILNGGFSSTASILKPTVDYSIVSIVADNSSNDAPEATTGAPIKLNLLGGSRNFSTQSMNGHIAEVIIYNKILTEDNRLKIESYLGAKWNLRVRACVSDDINKIRMRIGAFEGTQPLFDSNKAFVRPAEFSAKTGDVYFRIVDPEVNDNECSLTDTQVESGYTNNSDGFAMNIEIDKGSSSITNLTRDIISDIRRAVDITFKQRLFEAMVGTSSTSSFQIILRSALAIFITLVAIGFIMGLIKISITELFKMILKVGLLLTFLSPNSWSFFNDYVIEFFQGGAEQVASAMGAIVKTNLNPENDIFQVIDRSLNIIFASSVHTKIWGLLFSPFSLGWLYIVLIYMSFYIFLMAVGKALVLYVTIFIMFTVMFAIAPVFFVFSLFSKTRFLFEKWLSAVIGLGFQYAFIAAAVSLFGWMVYAMMYDLLYYGVCWKPLWICCPETPINIVLLSFWKVWSFDYRRFQLEAAVPEGPEFFGIVSLLAMMYIFKTFIDFITNLSEQIAGGTGVGGIANSMISAVKSAASDLADNPFTEDYKHRAKNFFVRRPIAAAERAVGIRAGEERGDIEAIQNTMQSASVEALADGKSGKDREGHIKAELKSKMEKRGMTDAQVEKIMKSPQVQKDLKDLSAIPSTAHAKKAIAKARKDAEAKGEDPDAAQAKAMGAIGRELGVRAEEETKLGRAKQGWRKVTGYKADNMKKNIALAAGNVVQEEREAKEDRLIHQKINDVRNLGKKMPKRLRRALNKDKVAEGMKQLNMQARATNVDPSAPPADPARRTNIDPSAPPKDDGKNKEEKD